MKPSRNMKLYASIHIAIMSIAITQIACSGELPFEIAVGRCPRPRTVMNFQPEKMQGVWYDIKRYKNTILKGSCGTLTYTWHPKNSSFTVPYEMLEFPTNDLTLRKLDVYNGKFRTNLNGFPTPFDSWFLDTDYENYHVFYTCVELIPNILNSQSLNILSRKPTLDEHFLLPILENLTTNKLDVSILRHVQQDDLVCRRRFEYYY